MIGRIVSSNGGTWHHAILPSDLLHTKKHDSVPLVIYLLKRELRRMNTLIRGFSRCMLCISFPCPVSQKTTVKTTILEHGGWGGGVGG